MSDLFEHVWPLARVGEAIEALALEAGLTSRRIVPGRDGEVPSVPRILLDRFERDAPDSARDLERWMEDAAEWLGVEIEPFGGKYLDLPSIVRSSGPSLLRVHTPNGRGFFALVGGSGRHATLLSPERGRVQVSAHAIERAVAAPLEAPHLPAIERLLDRAAVALDRREKARASLLSERLASRQLLGCFLVRMPPTSSFLAQARRAGVLRRFGVLVAAEIALLMIMSLGWSLLGGGALGGSLDRGWLYAWALLLVTMVPVRLIVSWVSGRLAIDVGALLKQRLLAGALALESDDVRSRGAGQLYGRVVESEAVESLALGGGIVGAIAILEILSSALILSAGAAPGAHLVVLALTILIAAIIALRYAREREAWTVARVTMTHDLVERMVGHRTRLAQSPADSWHAGEDASLARYLDRSARLDRLGLTLGNVVSRGFLAAAIALLAPAFVGGAATPTKIAISLGGILMARSALARLTSGARDVIGAMIAFREVAPLFNAQPPEPSHPDAALTTLEGQGSIIEAHELGFRYPTRVAPVLRGLSMRVQAGDRILIEGPSGAGKSTLGALLSGLREPTSGLLLLGGLDRRTIGRKGFRRRVASAPQFHDNHVLSNTFAFNLLMGRSWPPSNADLQLADTLCRELELGPLLDRMPAGLMQMVGETGWQLSHGEKSRLFMARALLQGARLVVLDESFAALDPETLSKSLKCVFQRAESLVVIAHP